MVVAVDEKSLWPAILCVSSYRTGSGKSVSHEPYTAATGGSLTRQMTHEFCASEPDASHGALKMGEDVNGCEGTEVKSGFNAGRGA